MTANSGNQIISSANYLPNFAAVSDLNEDGNMDIVISSRDEGVVSIRLGHGNGTFAEEITYSIITTY